MREAEGVEDIGKDSEDEVFLSPEPEDRPEGSRKSSRKKENRLRCILLMVRASGVQRSRLPQLTKIRRVTIPSFSTEEIAD